MGSRLRFLSALFRSCVYKNRFGGLECRALSDGVGNAEDSTEAKSRGGIAGHFYGMSGGTREGSAVPFFSRDRPQYVGLFLKGNGVDWAGIGSVLTAAFGFHGHCFDDGFSQIAVEHKDLWADVWAGSFGSA